MIHGLTERQKLLFITTKTDLVLWTIWFGDSKPVEFNYIWQRVCFQGYEPYMPCVNVVLSYSFQFLHIYLDISRLNICHSLDGTAPICGVCPQWYIRCQNLVIFSAISEVKEALSHGNTLLHNENKVIINLINYHELRLGNYVKPSDTHTHINVCTYKYKW